MSTAKDPEEMTDEELLREVASYDPEEYPIAKHAQRALERRQDDEEGSA